MALPKPSYPPVRPMGFSSPQEQISRAMELYAKYHPAAMQQRMYQTILKDESWKAAKEVEKLKILSQERTHVLNNLASMRKANSSGSGQGRGSAWHQIELAKLEQKRIEHADKHGWNVAQEINEMYTLPNNAKRLVNDVVETFTQDPGETGVPHDLANLANVLKKAARDVLIPEGILAQEGTFTETQKRLLAGTLYDELKAIPGFDALNAATDSTTLRDANAPTSVADAIDKQIPTGGFVSGLEREGISSYLALESEKKALMAGGTPTRGGGTAQDRGPGTGMWADKYGGGSAGTPAPAEDPEALFKARLGSLDSEIARLQQGPSPATRAARRTLGWESGVSPEAMAAAGASNSVGSELMAGALARVRSAGGSVKPKGAPEKWADQYIRQTQGRDFNAFWNEVNQQFPGPENSNARRKAGEYFGAFYYVFDAERQTLNAGTIAASPEEAVRDTPPVATAPPAAPPAAPPPTLTPPPAPLPTPAVAPVAAEEVFEGRINGAAVNDEAALRARIQQMQIDPNVPMSALDRLATELGMTTGDMMSIYGTDATPPVQ